MVFSSTTFLLAFFPLVAILYYICPRKLRNGLLLVFSLLYTPCVAAVPSIKRELGGKWAVGLVVGQCAIAWIAAFIVRIIGLALGGI